MIVYQIMYGLYEDGNGKNQQKTKLIMKQNMMLKDISNHPIVSIKDLSKSPQSSTTLPTLTLLKEELQITPNYDIPPEILQHTEKMAFTYHYPFSGPEDPLFVARCKEVEWIFSTRCLLDLHEDTIFHAVSYLDKYISLKSPPVPRLQLIAISCLVIASKMNQIYPVYFTNILSMFRVPYKNQQFLQTQSQIMSTFDYQFPSVSLNQLFNVYLIKFNLPKNILKKQSIISILQNILLDYQMMTYDIKCSAMSSVAIAAKMKRINFVLSSDVSLKKEYKCAFERLNEVIGKLRARISGKNKVNNPENSNKNIEL